MLVSLEGLGMTGSPKQKVESQQLGTHTVIVGGFLSEAHLVQVGQTSST